MVNQRRNQAQLGNSIPANAQPVLLANRQNGFQPQMGNSIPSNAQAVLVNDHMEVNQEGNSSGGRRRTRRGRRVKRRTHRHKRAHARTHHQKRRRN